MKPLPPALAAAALLAVPLPLSAECEPTDFRGATPLLGRNPLDPCRSPGPTTQLTWTDNCDDETGFEVQFFRTSEDEWVTFYTTRPDETLVSFDAGGPGASFDYRVRTLRPGGDSDWTPTLTLTNQADIAIRPAFAGGTVGIPFTGPAPFVSTLPNEAGAESFSVEDLPEGFTFDNATGIVSGTPSLPGVFRPTILAHHPDGTNTASAFLTIRIKPAPSGPRMVNALPAPLLLSPPTGPLEIDLASYFDDPDTTSAVRIATNLGDIDAILYAEPCPVTVGNFLNYVQQDAYRGAIFHRSATIASSGVDVVQAGLMKPEGNGDYTSIADPDIRNVIDEPAFSNLRGTLAMAKTSCPESGSSQWYFNVIDNTNLDGPRSNGGYTVFGRATPDSLAVIDDMHNRPRGSYPFVIDGQDESTLDDWPTTSAPAGEAPAPDELIQILSVTPIEQVLAYTLAGNDNPDLLNATITGTALTLAPVPRATGVARISLEVTDLDGAVVPAELSYCVLDLDMTPRLSPSGNLAVTFNHQKLPDTLLYEAQSSTDGTNWTTFWQSTDGLGAAAVVGSEDRGNEWRLTVADASVFPPAEPVALIRIRVTKS